MIPRSIGSIVKGFKIGVKKWFRSNTDIQIIWQRNYHEHIIRNEKSYQTTSDYIIDNPARWKDDKFYKKWNSCRGKKFSAPDECWMEIPKDFPNAFLHEYIVMPNHVHGIIELVNDANVGAENFLPLQNNMEHNVGVENFQPLRITP